MYRRKLEDVQKEAGGCTEGSLRLSDQMLIAASIAKIDNHHSLSRSVTHSLTREGRYRAAVIFQHSFVYIQSRYNWIIAEINVLQIELLGLLKIHAVGCLHCAEESMITPFAPFFMIISMSSY